MNDIKFIAIDYADPQQGKELLFLLNAYACDPMGGGEPISEKVSNHLLSELSRIEGAFTIIAYAKGEPAGFTTAFQGFSTFACQPLINIHDFAILNEYRGLGISQKLLAEVESVAIKRGCCKVTLEVLAGNLVARGAYEKFGFKGYALDPEMGQAIFLEKKLYQK